jgi:molybdenum cofactor cytidylyltransferase
MGIPGIILAAGPGSRFKGPRYKLLMPFRGKTILNRVIRTALDSNLESVWVVIGHERDLVWKALFSLPPSKRLHIIENPNYSEGRASTLRYGFKAIPKPIDYAMFLLGDQPLITEALINKLIVSVETNPDFPLYFPVSDGRKGNPIVYSNPIFKELISIKGDKSGFEIVEKYFDEAHKLSLKPTEADKTQLNVNTFEDYQELMKYEKR